mmetsp:Transcript_57674/g.159521  ORF Transcript_57674/g.159521 Transcript_57674/m.159521 type:complete len:218 (+) Transcript_57674:150-803(+)
MGVCFSLRSQPRVARLQNLLDPLVSPGEHDAVAVPLRDDLFRPALVGEVNDQGRRNALRTFRHRARDGPTLHGGALLATLLAVGAAGARDDEDVAVLGDPPLAAWKLRVVVLARPARTTDSPGSLAAPRLAGQHRRGPDRDSPPKGGPAAGWRCWCALGAGGLQEGRRRGRERGQTRCREQRGRGGGHPSRGPAPAGHWPALRSHGLVVVGRREGWA